MESRPQKSRIAPVSPMSRVAVLVLALVALAYGIHIGDGYLADDYFYLDRFSRGLVPLLKAVSVDSFYPKMIRPFPALFWSASLAPHGDVLQHALALLLHALNAFLIGYIIHRRTQVWGAAAAFAALFAVFPLFGEAVVWISSGYDLWSTFFILLALVVLMRGDADRGSVLRAGALYALGLLSKESIIVFPLLLPLLFPWPRIRRAFFIYGGLAAAYLAVRFALFGGIGGYRTDEGTLIVLTSSPLAMLRVLCLQIPSRVLMPLKYAGIYTSWILCASVLLFAGLAWTLRKADAPRAVMKGLLGACIALLPVATMIRIEYDHLGARLLYFPAAMLLVMLGVHLGKFPRAALALAAGLAALWTGITIANGSCWRDAARERDAVLGAIRQASGMYPESSTVMVDVHDTLRGAYVFNSGLDEAAKYYGIRGSIFWKNGTSAMLDSAAARGLGTSVFEMGFTVDGRAVDWTPCVLALRRSGPSAMMRWARPASAPGFTTTGTGTGILQLISPLEKADLPAGCYEMRLDFVNIPRSLKKNHFYWRTDPSVPFTAMDFREFIIERGPTSSVTLRLPPMIRPKVYFQWRVDFSEAVPADSLLSVILGPLPSDCPKPGIF